MDAKSLKELSAGWLLHRERIHVVGKLKNKQGEEKLPAPTGHVGTAAIPPREELNSGKTGIPH